MKSLIAFLDTEGSTNENNSLWDLSVVFKYVKNKNQFQNVFHVCNFNHGTHCKNISKPLKNFEKSIIYLKNYYCCDNLIFIMWNKSHDIRVLRRSGFSLAYSSVCLMKYLGKQKLNGPHSALGDVCKMLEFDFDIEKLLDSQKIEIQMNEENELESLVNNFKSSFKISEKNSVSLAIQKTKEKK